MGGPEWKVRSCSCPSFSCSMSKAGHCPPPRESGWGRQGKCGIRGGTPRHGSCEEVGHHVSPSMPLYKRTAPLESNSLSLWVIGDPGWNQTLPVLQRETACLPASDNNCSILRYAQLISNSWYVWKMAAYNHAENGKKKKEMDDLFENVPQMSVLPCGLLQWSQSHWSWEGQALYATWKLWTSPSPPGRRCLLGDDVGLGGSNESPLSSRGGRSFQCCRREHGLCFLFFFFFFKWVATFRSQHVTLTISGHFWLTK